MSEYRTQWEQDKYNIYKDNELIGSLKDDELAELIPEAGNFVLMKEQIENLTEQVADRETDIDYWEREHNSVVAQLEDAEEKFQDMESRLKDRVSDLEDECNSLIEEKDSLKDRILELEGELSQAEEEITRLREYM